jgi:hypothetical protein
MKKRNLLTGALLSAVFAMSNYISYVNGYIKGIKVMFDAGVGVKDSKKEEDEA